jgi:hypothetical protein
VTSFNTSHSGCDVAEVCPATLSFALQPHSQWPLPSIANKSAGPGRNSPLICNKGLFPIFCLRQPWWTPTFSRASKLKTGPPGSALCSISSRLLPKHWKPGTRKSDNYKNLSRRLIFGIGHPKPSAPPAYGRLFSLRFSGHVYCSDYSCGCSWLCSA